MSHHLRHYYSADGTAFVVRVDETGAGFCIRCAGRLASDEYEAERVGLPIGEGEPQPDGSVVVVCCGCRVSGDAELRL